MCAKKRTTSTTAENTIQVSAEHWPVYGHDWAANYLHKALLNQRLRQSYLIVGIPSIGKMQFARALAMALNCTAEDPAKRPCGECRSCRLIISGNHSDMVYSELDSNTGSLKIEALRDVMKRLSLKPYESRFRIAIIEDFDHAKGPAQDAILKTLEEPPDHAVLLLLATSTEQVLSTILSRCQKVYLRPVPLDTLQEILTSTYGAAPDQAQLLARLSGGRIGWAIDALREEDILAQRNTALDLLEKILDSNRAVRFDLSNNLAKDRAALLTLLELWQTYWRDILLSLENAPVKPCNSDRLDQIERMRLKMTADEALDALKATQNLMRQLDTNVNVRLALEVLMLQYPGLRR
jgi:DNA polymerase-3 subunit delta'